MWRFGKAGPADKSHVPACCEWKVNRKLVTLPPATDDQLDNRETETPARRPHPHWSARTWRRRTRYLASNSGRWVGTRWSPGHPRTLAARKEQKQKQPFNCASKTTWGPGPDRLPRDNMKETPSQNGRCISKQRGVRDLLPPATQRTIPLRLLHVQNIKKEVLPTGYTATKSTARAWTVRHR